RPCRAPPGTPPASAEYRTYVRWPVAPLRSPVRASGRMTLFLELLALAGLILLNAFLVGAEYGLVTSRRTRIRELDREGNRRARARPRNTRDPPPLISAETARGTHTS